MSVYIMHSVRCVLSILNLNERHDLAKQLGCEDLARNLWNNGKVCGQCDNFTPYGKRESGLNGSCSIGTVKRVKVESSCSNFKKYQGESNESN